MKSKEMKKETISYKDLSVKNSEMQSLYFERMERFMALVELSFALKTAPRIIQKK
jgi:hypothetical protein